MLMRNLSINREKFLRLYYTLLAKTRKRAHNPKKLKALKSRWVCNKHHIIPRSCEKYYEILRFLGGEVGELIWLTYREHERIHIYLIEISPNEEIRAKMQRALLFFYDKHGVVFSEKEKKRHREAGSAALTYRNRKFKYKMRGRSYINTIEAQKGDKHPSHKKEWKEKTQVAILWGDKAETICLIIIVSLNSKRRIFGGFCGSPRSWGSFNNGATAKNCYWFKYFDHYTIKEYKTRREALKARTELEKKIKPKYKGQFNQDHVLTYRAQCKYERTMTRTTHTIHTTTGAENAYQS